jgi:hypothetical protein
MCRKRSARWVRLGRSSDQISIGEIIRVFEPKDCPANFQPYADADAALARLVSKANSGFFQPPAPVASAARISGYG